MKTLLITNYWYPWNHPNTMTFIGFGKYIKFDVLTQRRPNQSFRDYTIPDYVYKTIKFGWRLPAVMWGFLAVIPALFTRYDTYLITSPPESLLFTACVLRKLGRKVVVYVQDEIDREKQPHKWLNWLYRFCYRNIFCKIVSWKIIDNKCPVIYHGYEDLQLKRKGKPVFYNSRVSYEDYLTFASYGIFPDFSHKPKGYVASSAHTVVHLGFKPNQELAEEEYGQHSWEEGANRLKKFL